MSAAPGTLEALIERLEVASAEMLRLAGLPNVSDGAVARLLHRRLGIRLALSYAREEARLQGLTQ